jgi:hypothetical protein
MELIALRAFLGRMPRTTEGSCVHYKQAPFMKVVIVRNNMPIQNYLDLWTLSVVRNSK